MTVEIIIALFTGLLASFGAGIIYFLKKLYERTEYLSEQIVNLKIDVLNKK